MKTRNEKSAGIILYYFDKAPRFLLLKYPSYWGFAKGIIEMGESDAEAAKREVKEETGIEKVEIIEGFQYKQKWFFSLKGELVRKEAVFFLGKIKKHDAENTKISSEHDAFEWLEYGDALKRLKIKSNRDMLSAAYNYAENLEKQKKLF